MLTPTLIARTFLFKGKDNVSVQLADPSPEFSAEQVLDFYSATYPELVTAKVIGPEFVGEKLQFSFESVLGTKG